MSQPESVSFFSHMKPKEISLTINLHEKELKRSEMNIKKKKIKFTFLHPI